jgi:Spy/CpxP family protein refolding chaperone
VAVGIAALGLCEAQTNINASPPQPERQSQMDNDPINRLGQELSLSKDQKNKLHTVFTETREKIQTAVQQAMTNADTEMKRILTPEQYQKLQALEHRHLQESEPAPEGAHPEPNTGSSRK